jgi:DNA gyrase/topoisomerase IV subunit B
MSSENLATQYQQKTDKQHILDNPDTYIGSVETIDSNMWIFDDTKSMIDLKTIEYNPGLYKLFDEAIVNARDHVVRMIQSQNADKKNVTFIETTISEDGTITIINDGNGIDVAKHPENQLWIPEMVFGHLRTSTNYNKDEKKIVGGKNGFGFKLVLIWSTYGYIETVDHTRGLKYTQEFKSNLDEICTPTITKCKTAKPYTKIVFKPDYARLGLQGLTSDIMALFKKRVYDIGAVTDHSVKKIKVIYNGEPVPIKNFVQYIDLYIGQKSDTPRVYETPNDRWEYAVGISKTHEFAQISFVNGICTHKGGKHVDYIMGQICRKLCEYIEKKKKIKVNPSAIKEQLILFLRCDIENPSFDSQTKDCMNTPSNKFGSTCSVTDSFIEKLAKMGVMDMACSLTEAKETKLAKKSDGSKTKTIRGIQNLIDANFSGTADSHKCTLILCEGLSAMSGIVSGLSSEDRNTIGIYPLKGKLLNVRGEQTKKISDNKEITDIKKIVGLEIGKKYETIDDVNRHLRYGKIMIMTDQDLDGSHIKGLCINLFHSEWASLIKIPGFISFMNTPILRAKKGQQVLHFYNDGEYNTWKESFGSGTGTNGLGTNTNNWTIKYFKGLGTSTAVEFKEYFANKKIVDFAYSGDISDDTIDKIFNKKRPDDRKQWLENYDKTAFLNTSKQQVMYEEFIDKEMIHFSTYDCARSIPNMIDGLKISLRKILFAAFKRRLTSEIKVAQFSGYVSEHSAYHHGEASLNGAIIKMAQNFVGSNNINLLEPNGQFGCLSPETKILLWDNTIKPAIDIKVGDELVGDDGTKRIVLQTTSGIDDMFHINLSNGKSFTANSQHMLTLYSETDNNTVDMKLCDYIILSNDEKDAFYMMNNVSPIQWENKTVPIDPYILGSWLAYNNSITSSFKEILIKNLADFYMTNSEDVRLHVLAGYIDIISNSIIDNNTELPYIELPQYNIIHGIIQKLDNIAQSLGFYTTYTDTDNDNVTDNDDDYKKKLRIYGNQLDKIPTRVPANKIKIVNKEKYTKHLSHFTIEPIGKGEFCGWMIDNNERFLLADYTVTHNSRLIGGDDAASERYIFTLLNSLTRYIFPEADDAVLTYKDDDGTLVEPEYYVPIIPFCLMNGISGIGTGFSCEIPSYNPKDIVSYLKSKLVSSTNTDSIEFIPYYEGYKGTVEKIGEHKYLIKGKYEVIGEDKIRITELPIGTWTMPYITFLEGLLDGTVDKSGKKNQPAIKDMVSMSTEVTVDITVTFPKGKLAELLASNDATNVNGLEKILKLTTTISTTNMHMFNAESKLHKYTSIEEIIEEFYVTRMKLYEVRKDALITDMNKLLVKLSNRARYILDMLSGTIDLRKKTNKQVQELLEGMKYATIDGEFKYLIKMPMDSVTEEHVANILKEKADTEAELAVLMNTSTSQMWLKELDLFEKEYENYKKKRELIQMGSSVTKQDKKPKLKIVKKMIKDNK